MISIRMFVQRKLKARNESLQQQWCEFKARAGLSRVEMSEEKKNEEASSQNFEKKEKKRKNPGQFGAE